MVDNFSQIKPLLDFSSGNYIRVQMSRRFKDQPLTRERLTVLTDYFFGSVADLEREYPRLQSEADTINARLYITPNPEALSAPYKEELRMFGRLFGDKPLYGASPESLRYLLYDADTGREERSEQIWSLAGEAGLQVMRFPTVSGEGFILHACDYAAVFGQHNGFHSQCWALLYYGK